MASIGAVSCTFLRGEVPPMRQTVETWHTPGIAGHGAQTLGLAAIDFQLSAVLISTKVLALAWAAALAALQGTVVTIVSDIGASYTYCLIEEVGQPKMTTAWRPGAATEVRCEIQVKGKRVGSG